MGRGASVGFWGKGGGGKLRCGVARLLVSHKIMHCTYILYVVTHVVYMCISGKTYISITI